jgi:hypothetical protein
MKDMGLCLNMRRGAVDEVRLTEAAISVSIPMYLRDVAIVRAV